MCISLTGSPLTEITDDNSVGVGPLGRVGCPYSCKENRVVSRSTDTHIFSSPTILSYSLNHSLGLSSGWLSLGTKGNL